MAPFITILWLWRRPKTKTQRNLGSDHPFYLLLDCLKERCLAQLVVVSLLFLFILNYNCNRMVGIPRYYVSRLNDFCLLLVSDRIRLTVSDSRVQYIYIKKAFTFICFFLSSYYFLANLCLSWAPYLYKIYKDPNLKSITLSPCRGGNK